MYKYLVKLIILRSLDECNANSFSSTGVSLSRRLTERHFLKGGSKMDRDGYKVMIA